MDVPLPAGIARYQCRLLTRVILARPPKDRGTQVARVPGALEVEQKLGALVGRATQAQRQAESSGYTIDWRSNFIAAAVSPRNRASVICSRAGIGKRKVM